MRCNSRNNKRKRKRIWRQKEYKEAKTVNNIVTISIRDGNKKRKGKKRIWLKYDQWTGDKSWE